MLKKLYIILICCLTGLSYRVHAQSLRTTSPVILRDTTAKADTTADDDDDDSGKDDSKNDVSTVVIAGDKNAIFQDAAKYSFVVKNPTGNVQEGTVSYLVTTMAGVKVKEDVRKVNISRKGSQQYDFSMPGLQVGFYKVSFMVNVTDYDDTTLKTFGIRPQQIISEHPKPADFDEFWANTKAELAKVSPNFKMIPQPKLYTKNRYVYLIEMKSLDNLTIRAWMTIPKTVDHGRKFAVILALPGYQVPLSPIGGPDEDFAIISLNVRGQGNSRDVIHTTHDDYIFYHIEDKNKYVMRGVIMDCIRCVDFIYSRPELKHNQIVTTGGSMGGFLSIALPSLDKRIALTSIQNPILCDVRQLMSQAEWPANHIKKYILTKPGLTLDKVLDNMDYFDAKNFATNLHCNTLMGIGLLDPLAPPNTEYAAYNNMPSKKKLMVFKDIGHEVDHNIYKGYESKWIHDTFALF